MKKFQLDLKKYIPTHKHLREFATTLNYFSFIEISIVCFFTYLSYDLLMWYKEITTPETFSPTAFWGAISSIVAAIFGAIKYINDTHKKKE